MASSTAAKIRARNLALKRSNFPLILIAMFVLGCPLRPRKRAIGTTSLGRRARRPVTARVPTLRRAQAGELTRQLIGASFPLVSRNALSQALFSCFLAFWPSSTALHCYRPIAIDNNERRWRCGDALLRARAYDNACFGVCANGLV
jgi:hypothetical protein